LSEAPHVDLAGYVLGMLEAEERERFEAHLEDCVDCRRSLAELGPAAVALRRAASPADVPAGLEARTLLAVERAAAGRREPRPRTRRLLAPRRLGLAAVAAAALVLAGFVGTLLDRDGVGGTLEFRATLVDPRGGPVTGRARVVKTGIGRVIVFDSDRLPILPTGEYYEIWFVGPGDSRARPNRISAGTFHPDEDGRSHVRFAAAVDPKKYPVLSVTAEPGDGNPAWTGPEVLRSRAAR
jgi:anti-sigma-K factor RskA